MSSTTRRRIRRRYGATVPLAALAALLSLITSEAAAAQQRDPANPTCPLNPNWSSYARMRFTEREIGGRTILLAEGQIDDELIPRLEQALQGFRGSEIWLRSPGGNALVADRAGRLIRERNLATHIPEGWACFSACTYMFIGGKDRSIEPGGLLIVNMFTFTADPALRRRIADGEVGDALLTEIGRAAAQRATEDNDFLIRMGVSRRFLTDIVYRQHAIPSARDPSTRRCITIAEARRYNVVNDRQPAADFMPPDASSRSPSPPGK